MAAIVALILANVIWGAGSPIFKYALNGGIPPFTLAFIRFFTAGLIFLPLALRYKVKITPSSMWLVVMGGIWGISICISFFFAGLKLAPSINANIIGSLGPVILYILSLRFLGEKPHPQIVKGIMISLVGTAVIVFAPFFATSAQTLVTQQNTVSTLLGNFFFILATIGVVMMTIYNKQVVGKVHPYMLICIQFFIGSVAFVPFMLWELQTWSFLSLNFRGWVGIIFGVIFSSALAFYAYNYALTKMHAQEIGVFTYIMPVVGVLVAIPLLGEFPDIFFVIGAVLIFIGVFVSERHPHFRKIHGKIGAGGR